MKLKLIFGVAIPALIIVLLTILSSLDVGFSVHKEFAKKLTIDDIFVNSTLRNQIEVGEVVLTNGYFMPKRYELPGTYACLVDNDKVKQSQNAGYLTYSEGDSQYPGNNYYDSYYYYNYNQRSGTSVEIGSNAEKRVKIYLHPEGISAYSYDSTKTQQELLLDNYGDYDVLVFIENSDKPTYYNDCYSLTQSQIDAARKISLK